MNRDAVYWMTLAHNLPIWSFSNREGWRNEDKNNLIIKFFQEKQTSIEAFFQLSEHDWKYDYHLTDRQIVELVRLKSIFPNNAFIAEALLNSGVEIIPIISQDYPPILKRNL
ncbi:MAG: hypothetical protein LBQ64_06295, partial [Bacteroidales bacterium]|nr:hypothetical protein [Bacteroidales bacterium]